MTQTLPSQRNEATRLHVLVSYAYWNHPQHLKTLYDAPPEWNLMLDSGAFTSFTQGAVATPVQEYAAFGREHQSLFWRIINLDRIGDPETSASNLHHLHSNGVQVVPVFQRGDDPRNLPGMAQQGYPVCVGGISQNRNATKERQYLDSILQLVKQHDMRVHLLGVGGDALFTMPCFSGDSSSWSMASRFGVMQLWHRGRMVAFSKSPSSKRSSAYVRPDLERTAVLRSYGISWSELGEYHRWSVNDDNTVYIASIQSYIRLARTLANQGKRYILACVPSHLQYIKRAWDLEKHAWT